MSHPSQQRLFMEDVPLLIPDDDVEYSFDSPVELSFFDTSSIFPDVHAHDRSEVERPFRFAPVRPLELKRRQEQYYDTTNSTFGIPPVSRSVSDNVVLQQRRQPPPPPRASVMPRSPSIASRSSFTDIMAPSFAMTTSSFQLRRLSFDEPAQTSVPLRPADPRCHTIATESPFSDNNTGTPFKRNATSPSPVSPTDMHFGLDGYNAGAYDVGLSPDSMSSPSDCGSARFNRCDKESFCAFDRGEMQEEELDHAPMTPSRAGSKALQVLGAYVMPTKPVRNPYKQSSKEHYRPLPAAVFQEIDTFFGFSPQTTKRAQKSSKRTPASQLTICTVVDEQGQVWEDEVERKEFTGLLSQQRSENDARRNGSTDARSQTVALLPAIRLRSKASMERQSTNRGPVTSSPLAPTHDNVAIFGDARGSGEEEEEDIFGSVGSLSKTANGINLANTRVKERNRLNRQLSHPPPKAQKMSFLQDDPYAATPIRDFDQHAQPIFKRKQPPAALTLKGRAPSTINKFVVEQIVSGRPSLPTAQLPVRTTSKSPFAAPQSALPQTPFMAPRTAPVPPGAPKAPGRLLITTLASHNSEASDSSGPHTPSTPSPKPPRAPALGHAPNSKHTQQIAARPTPTRGMSFFEDSPPPDQTHFRLGVNSKAAMKEVSGRLRRVVRL
ncbi:hypothetical protein QFC22_005381 [Naganishia vaughanmartiniae]|uniref:Uncharacterized protein n=1 Tax=Naganishia vaughanmartiniae TaxID=1424756 RepID=A0ACC2WUD6_9TREE|nr:hypothetical protein QFC22_005381 [Naganishia vaughanmartiniae]